MAATVTEEKMLSTDCEPKEEKNKEGQDLLGSPTFEQLENGRFRCVETGHEMPSKAMDSYSNSKRCRLGLINHALSKKKPPLNMFKQDPLSSSKIICKLTGDTVNKSEEHIWKHINGKRFFNKLEQKEAGKLTSSEVKKGEGMPPKEEEEALNGEVKKKKKKNKNKKEEQGSVDKITSEPRKLSDQDTDSEEEADFWEPPAGSRWDFDDGGDRWGSDCDSGEADEATDGMEGDGENDSAELSMRTKRMSIEVGPSSFASRKKKKKIDPSI